MKSWRIGFLTIRGGSGILATMIVVAAVALAIAPEFVQNHVGLSTDAVIGRLELWQVATWMVVPNRNAFSIIIGVIIVLSMGSQLEMTWGSLKFWRVIAGITIVTGTLTSLVGLVASGLGKYAFDGVSVVTLVIWVSIGLLRRHTLINFWGLAVSGYMFALIGVGFSVLSAMLAGAWLAIIPDAIAAGATYLVVFHEFPGGVWIRFRSWQLQRELNKRSAHLRSIDGGRNMGRDSDKYLH